MEASNDGNFTVLRNGVDVSSNLSAINQTVMDLSVQITRTKIDEIESSFSNGVTVTVKITSGVPNFVILMPVEFQTYTVGLLGNYNGNKTDDFVSRNGTLLSDNSTDEEIHELGQSCKSGHSATFELF